MGSRKLALPNQPAGGARRPKARKSARQKAEQMILTAVIGGAEAEFTVHMLLCLLEGQTNTRVGVVTPDGAFLDRKIAAPPGELSDLLEFLRLERCTHVILSPDEAMLRQCGALRVSVTALAASVHFTAELRRLLGNSDMVISNLDDAPSEALPGRVLTYSEGRREADLVAQNLRLFPGHTEFEAVTVGQIQRIHLPVPGGFALYHALCVLSCGLCLGLSLERMADTLRCVHGPQGQLEVLSIPAAYTVVLDRADTPGGLERLLACVREFTARSLVCLLSCRDGCGWERAFAMGGVAGQMADQIILVPDSAAARAGIDPWERPYTVESDRRRAVFRALENAQAGDVIVLAGYSPGCSPSIQDEREMVRSYVCHRRSQPGRRAVYTL